MTLHRLTCYLSLLSLIFAGARTAQSSVPADTARLAWARHYASGSIYDQPIAMAVDVSGNVYVTGTSYGPATGADYTTVKYTSLGVEEWVARFNGYASQHDIPAAIAVDGSGNVYVTGRSTDSSNQYNFATIKYGPSGNEIWVSRYNGTGNSGDEATAIALDALGNAYVTGYSYGVGTSVDYVTIRYDASGVEQWVARYNGLANLFDYPYAITIDGNGYVYITGSSYSSSTLAEFATVKYDPSGTEQWVARYHHPVASADGSPKKIALDVAGNVYVAGYSNGGPTSGNDFTIVKYNSAGTEQWVKRYTGPGTNSDYVEGLAVDNVGNVFITGRSYGGPATREDYTTVKYNSSGAEQWVARYNGPASTFDFPKDLAIDQVGNVFVTGASYGTTGIDDFATVKYNSSGVQQWVSRHGGTGNDQANVVVLDQNGNVYVTGSSSRPVTYADGDFTTIKYNPSGIEQWIAYYRGWRDSFAFTTAISSDGAGGAYVSGWSQTYLGTEDYTTLRYDAQGRELWIQRYNGSADSADRASALTVDPSGNVIVTGTSRGTNDDYATVKYSPAGMQQWVQRYNGPGNAADGASAITSDGSGNVYVTGKSFGTGSGEDFATVKYNPTGLQQWVARYNGSANGNDQATALAVDASSNVYVTGCSVGSSSLRDYATVKYDASGQIQWVARYDGPGHLNDEPNSIALDPGGNVYITGRSGDLSTDYDCVTAKYSPTGQQLWALRYSSVGSAFDEGKSVLVEPTGDVYVAGTTARLTYDCLVLKYSSDGVEQWVRFYDGPASGSDFANILASDSAGNIYVSGTSDGLGTGKDMFTLRYEQSGAVNWLARYNEWGNPDDGVSSIAVEQNGTVWLAGTSSFIFDQHIYTVLKYEQDLVLSAPEDEQQPSSTGLHQNYPNPFNPSTTIRYAIPKAMQVTLTVYDLLGRKVATLVNEQKVAGNYEVTWHASNRASGIYLYRLETGSYVQTRKLMLLK